MLQAIGEVAIVTHCANTAQICGKVVFDELDVYGSDGHVPVFLGLASSSQALWFFKGVDDTVDGVLMQGP